MVVVTVLKYRRDFQITVSLCRTTQVSLYFELAVR